MFEYVGICHNGQTVELRTLPIDHGFGDEALRRGSSFLEQNCVFSKVAVIES